MGSWTGHVRPSRSTTRSAACIRGRTRSSFLKGERIILRSARAVAPGPLTVVAEPGTVLEAHGDALLVATGRGALALNEIQREGKRPTTTREFLAGHAVAEGDRFLAHP